MGLLSALNASVTGMAAQANYLSSISENISNSNTVGYKEADTQFQDLVDQAGVAGDYAADGVTTSIRYNVSEQGDLTSTSSATDLGIEGNGFFLVQDTSGDIFLTRAGSFSTNGSGNLVNSAGYTLLKAFGDSPYVGLQYDPSHLVRQFMDPIQTARDFVDSIYDVHLKDTEIFWPILRAGGINPVNKARWWTYRIPGMGSINWRDFFSVLQEAGYTGAMSVEQEDPFYGADDPGPDFSPDFKMGFVMAKRYLTQYVL